MQQSIRLLRFFFDHSSSSMASCSTSSSTSGTVPVASTVVATTTPVTTATTTADSASADATPAPFFAPTAYTVMHQQHPWHAFPGAYNSSFLGGTLPPPPGGYPAAYAFSASPPSRLPSQQSGGVSPSSAAFTAPFASFRPPAAAAWNTLTFPRFVRGFQGPAGLYPQAYPVPSSGADSAKASRGRSSLLLPRPSPVFPDSGRGQLRRPLATKACDKVTVAIAGALAPDCYLSLGTSAPRQRHDGAVVAGEHFGKGDAAAALVKCNGKETSEKQRHVAVTAGGERRGAVCSDAAAADCSSLEGESVLDGEELPPHKESEVERRQKVASKKEHPESHDLKNPWNEGMVRFLFESYEAIHTKLNSEGNGNGQGGNSKYHKKWSPILCLMKEKFGREFTKHQCQSKYYKVRRECAKYTLLYKKKKKKAAAAQCAGVVADDRELQRPKFYEIWQEFGSKTGKKTNNYPQISPLILDLCMSDAEEVSQEIEEEEEQQAGSEEEKVEDEDEDLFSPSSEERTQQCTKGGDPVSAGTQTNSQVVQERPILKISVPSSPANTQGSEHQEEKTAALCGPIAAAEKQERQPMAGNAEGHGLWKRGEGVGFEHGIGVDLNIGFNRWDNLGRSPTAMAATSSPTAAIEKQQQVDGDDGAAAQCSVLGSRERQCLQGVKRKKGATTLSEKGEVVEEASLASLDDLKQDTNRLGLALAKRIKKVDDLQLMREMQMLLCTQLKACEKREESIRLWGEVKSAPCFF